MFGRRFKTMTDTILGLTDEIPLILIFFLGIFMLLISIMQLGQPG